MVQLEKVEEPSAEASPEAMPEASPVPSAPEEPAEAPPETPAEAPTPAPKRRGRPKGEPKPKPEPPKRGKPKKVETGEPEVRTYTPEPPRPVVTHQDFMRYVAMQSQVSKQLQRDPWRNLVRF